jgi:hypothetical protein
MNFNGCDFYRAENGAQFIIGKLGRPLYYSSNGKRFFQLVCDGFGGSTVDYHIGFTNPHNNKKGDLIVQGKVLTFNQKQFSHIPAHDVADSDIVAIPAIRQGEMLFVLDEKGKKTYIYVSRDRYNGTYETIRFFMGTKTAMKRVAIVEYEYYRDGGSTRITTLSGSLWAPFMKIATWNGKRLKTLKVSNYRVEETENIAVIQ